MPPYILIVISIEHAWFCSHRRSFKRIYMLYSSYIFCTFVLI